jgi:chemotaxis signal transduction protein
MLSEVQDIMDENIEEVPEYGCAEKQEFLKGLGKIKNNVIMILDSNKICSEEEKMQIEINTDNLQKESALV